MNTATMTHYAFTVKAPNNAKFGACAPKDGYINSWNEEVPEPETAEEWDWLDEASEEERQWALKAYEEHMGVPFPG